MAVHDKDALAEAAFDARHGQVEVDVFDAGIGQHGGDVFSDGLSVVVHASAQRLDKARQLHVPVLGILDSCLTNKRDVLAVCDLSVLSAEGHVQRLQLRQRICKGRHAQRGRRVDGVCAGQPEEREQWSLQLFDLCFGLHLRPLFNLRQRDFSAKGILAVAHGTVEKRLVRNQVQAVFETVVLQPSVMVEAVRDVLSEDCTHDVAVAVLFGDTKLSRQGKIPAGAVPLDGDAAHALRVSHLIR